MCSCLNNDKMLSVKESSFSFFLHPWPWTAIMRYRKAAILGANRANDTEISSVVNHSGATEEETMLSLQPVEFHRILMNEC